MNEAVIDSFSRTHSFHRLPDESNEKKNEMFHFQSKFSFTITTMILISQQQ